jgi:hypothetical protein
VTKDRNQMSRTIRIVAAQRIAAALPGTRAAVTALVFALTVLTAGNLLPQAFAMADAAGGRLGITVTNTVPEFTLTLPDRYVQVKSTGDALCTFGTKDQTAGALVAVYPLGHTIEPGTALAERRSGIWIWTGVTT